MNIDKSQIIDTLRALGKHDQASQVSNTLPDQVDTDNSAHQDLLSKLGLNLDDYKDKLGGFGKLL